MNIELLAPAGDLEKLKFAVHYGADAVYLAGERFGLRAFAGNFKTEDLREGLHFAHAHGVKVYVAVNMYPHNEDLVGLESYVHELEGMGVDALIVADPGIYYLIQKSGVGLPIHISTQATTVNWADVLFWKNMPAVERVVLARELNLKEIGEIHAKAPDMALEAFVHGAMCMSYSGRCLISNYLTGRDANRGACAQPCRWQYALVEEKRPNRFYPVEQDEKGSYIFNSHDLCLIQHLNDMISAGVSSLKIEGRMKSVFYVATVVRAYRQALNAVLKGRVDEDITYWLKELETISHRPYTTGFMYGHPDDGAISSQKGGYIQPYDFCGIVLEYDEKNKRALIEERNKLNLGDVIQFIGKDYRQIEQTIEALYLEDGTSVETVNQAQMHFWLPTEAPVKPMDLIRRAHHEG